MALHRDIEFPQKTLGHGSRGHPRRGFPGAGTLENIAKVAVIVFDAAGKVGMSRARPSKGIPFLGIGIRRHDFFPAFVVPIGDPKGNRRAERHAPANTRQEFPLVGFYLHASAAAVSRLAAGEFPGNIFQAKRQPRGKTFHNHHQPLAVGFPRGQVTQ